MKYVGYTSDPLNKRFSHHRNHITAGTEGHLIMHHFMKHHRISNMKVKPIEIYKDPSTIRDKERHWMRELNTLPIWSDAYIHVTSEHPNSKSIYEYFNRVESRRSNQWSTNSRITPEQ